MISGILGALGALALVILPGNWIAFGLPLSSLSFWPRFSCGVLLSPTVVFLQYTLLRWANVPFGRAVLFLTLINLPAAWLILRGDRPVIPKRTTLLAWCAAVLLPFGFLTLWMQNTTVRANWGHAWLHSDMVYMIANGGIRPEDPFLAGVPMAYPWLVDAYQGIASYLIDRSPNWSYMWINAIWLFCTIALLAELVEQMGGALWAGTSSVLFLCFGVNAAGFVLFHLLPKSFTNNHALWGDGRYSPWIRKFGAFAGTALGISLVTALAVIMTRALEASRRRSWWVLTVALLVALALSYPVLFPVGGLLVGARLLVAVFHRWRSSEPGPFREIVEPIIALLIGVVVTAVWVHVVTLNRVGPTMVTRPISNLRGQAVITVIVLLPLLLGVLLSGFFMLKRRAEATFILLSTAAGCMVAHTLFDINFPNLEYKFIFTAAVCMTPFAAIAWENIAKTSGRWAAPLFALIALVLVVSGFKPLTSMGRFLFRGGRPKADVSQFAFRLQPGEPFGALGVAVRTKSAENSVLITGPINRDLVTLTQRPLFIPYEATRAIVGVVMTSNSLLNRDLGYDPRLIDRRRNLVHSLYETTDDELRSAQFDAISAEMKRPIVIVVDEQQDANLERWLSKRSDSELLYSGEGVAAWGVHDARPATVQ